MAHPLPILIIFCSIATAMSFITNCAQFDPNNFNNCLACIQNYYFASGKCIACPSPLNNISFCQQPTSSTPNNSNASQPSGNTTNNQTNANLTNTTQTGNNQTNATATNSTQTNTTQSNSNQSSTTTLQANNANTTSASNNSASANQNKSAPTTSNNTNQTNNQNSVSPPPTPISVTTPPTLPAPASASTPVSASVSVSVPASAPAPTATSVQQSQASQLQLFQQLLPTNCIQFVFTLQGIQCTQCQGNYILSSTGTCSLNNAPVNPPANPAPANTPTTNSANNPTLTPTPAASPTIPITISAPTSPPVSPVPPAQTKPQTILPTQPIQSATNGIYTTAVSSSTKDSSQIYQSSQSKQTSTTNIFYQNLPQPALTVSTSTFSNSTNSTSTASLSNSSTITTTTAPYGYPPANPPYDLNCLQTNPNYSTQQPISLQNQRCLSCFSSFYYNISQQLCIPQNPLCRQCNNQNACLSCYPGYTLVNSACVISSILSPPIVSSQSPYNTQHTQTYPSRIILTPVQDPNCNQYLPNSNQCAVCANRFYIAQPSGLCTQVNPACRTWNNSTGACLSCYTGYAPTSTSQGTCNALPQPISTTSTVVDPNQYKAYCQTSKNNICVQCIFRYYLLNSLCFPVSDQCKAYNATYGFCLSCYQGYSLDNGVCSPTISATANDPYCQTAGTLGCQLCIQSYYPDTQGVCQPVNPLCNGYDPTNGACTDCFLPYTLTNGNCVYLYSRLLNTEPSRE